MSDKTDEVARAIAECQHVDFFNFDPLFKQERFADLQKFARLWLLIPNIIDASGNIDGYDEIHAVLTSLGVDVQQIQHDIWDKKIVLKPIKELDG